MPWQSTTAEPKRTDVQLATAVYHHEAVVNHSGPVDLTGRPREEARPVRFFYRARRHDLSVTLLVDRVHRTSGSAAHCSTARTTSKELG